MKNIISLGKVLYKPNNTLNMQLQKKDLSPKIIIICIITTLLAIVSTLSTREEQITLILGSSIDEHLFDAYKTFMLVGVAFSALINPLIIIFINTLSFYILFIILRVKSNFRVIFCLGIFAYIPLLIDLFLRTIIQLITKEPISISPTSLFFFLQGSESFIANILITISLTSLWQFFIYYKGFKLIFENKQQTKVKSVLIFIAMFSLIINPIIQM
ncbi:YIP1 family protein [Virgibacillus proomii]|jgi:hypothetical protein|uniref:YIP1 family protein n=1 Tax=Virgibacillus proomii TaxID=84407 RepID=UPI0009876285|nr:YIP1 family protein [Virgibacillus proomii]